MRMLSLGLLLILVGLLYLFDIPRSHAQYGGPPMWDQGPGRRDDRYDYPPNYVPPFERPRMRRYGPQPGPCIYEGNCRGPRYETPDYVRPRWD